MTSFVVQNNTGVSPAASSAEMRTRRREALASALASAQRKIIQAELDLIAARAAVAQAEADLAADDTRGAPNGLD